jgi:DNA sulfur modification protein DndD
MQFERLVIENLGVFRGQHSIDLSMTNEARPIILVGALNGGGKTTIIEVLQLALYGKRAAFGWRGATAYPQYLQNIRNNHAAVNEPTVAEVSLRLIDGRRVRVRRQWSFTKASPKEYISVFLNGAEEPDLILSETWEEEIERLLPARLSELFFFDGERIEKLANPGESADLLRSAVASLLGLDLVDHLTADLEILRTRQKQKLLSDSDRESLEGLATQLDAAAQQREDLAQLKASSVARLDYALKEKETIDRRVREQGGDRFAQRETLSESTSTERGRYRALEQQLRQVANGVLPLKLILPMLERLHLQSQANLSASDASGGAALDRFLTSFIRWVGDQPFPKSVKSELTNYAMAAQPRSLVTSATPSDTNWDKIGRRLESLLSNTLGAATANVETILAELTASGEKLAALEEQLAKVPEQEQLAMVLRAQGAADAAIVRYRADIEQADKQISAMDRSISVLKHQRETLLERTAEAGDAARTAEYCQRAHRTLLQFREKLVRSRQQQLERLILEAFQILLRKPDLVGEIKVNSESMSVSLFTPNGQPLSTQQLSAGERQLLAVAMLWGLARASGRPIPVVIDTPLGRLDGAHRQNLVTRYFPDASHQVILLSTDEEVDAKFSSALDQSVAHRYLLDYDPSTRSSAFSNGYFGA